MPDRSPHMLAEFLKSRTMVTFEEVQAALGGASRATAFRYLAQVPYRRSYNHNGRYYALHDPARYDRLGLWSRGEVLFSVDGSLRATVHRLVTEAEAGATQRELQDRLRVRVRTTLLDLLRKGEIGRARLAEVFVYLHEDPAVRQAQIQRREQRVAADQIATVDGGLSDAVIIHVLLTLVRHPGAQAANVVRHLHGLDPPVTLPQVQAVFTRFDLGKKGGPSTH
jgi:hypothetical protein